jgi:prevent-host-death family protein
MQVSTLEAKNHLSALLAEVAKGTEVIITKRGTPVARLTPIEPAFDRDKARRAADGLRKISREVTLGGLKIKDLVNEGRS